MAMTAASLRDRFLAATASLDHESSLAEIYLALATAVVAEIQTNGVVTVPLGIPVAVVLPAGTGATTAPATGSIS